MSIKGKLAKVAPKAVSDRAIDKGEHDGDDWAMVSVVMAKMCTQVVNRNRKSMDFVYDGNVVGFAKQDGTAWCDDKAYPKIKEAFEALPAEEKDMCLAQVDMIRDMTEAGLPSHPRQVRELQAQARRESRTALLEDEIGSDYGEDDEPDDEQEYDGDDY